MLVMIGAYMIMGFMRVSTEGDGQVSYGHYSYPKTAFLPFGSTIWTLGILAVLSAGDLYIAIAAFGATTSATKGGCASRQPQRLSAGGWARRGEAGASGSCSQPLPVWGGGSRCVCLAVGATDSGAGEERARGAGR